MGATANAIALDAAHRYFGEKISENLSFTPEGFLICRNAIIGRTGFQTYLVRELAANDPDGLVKDLDPEMEVQVWRDASQVFAPQAMASFEGKTFTVYHPPQMLNPENNGDYDHGDIRNVHQGDEVLEGGNNPLLADIIVKSAEAIREIMERGVRKLSCGYYYRLTKTGNRFEQRQIIGNHVALVLNPRAGQEAQINDEAAKPGRFVPMKIKELIAAGLKQAFSKTDDPKELAAAFDEAVAGTVQPPQSQLDAEAEEVKKKEKEASDAKAAKDAAEEKEKEDATKKEKEASDAKAAADAKAAKDAAEAEEKKKAEDAAKPGAKDSDGGERRTKMHAALDKILDNADKKASMEDADMGELETLMGEHFSGANDSEKKEGEDEDISPIADDEMCAGDKKAKDGEILQPEPVLTGEEIPQSQLDQAALDAQFSLLQTMRPVIIASKDKGAKDWFNGQLSSLAVARAKAGTGTPSGGYGAFGGAARQLSEAADESIKQGQETAEQRAKRFDALYAEDMKKRTGAKV